MTAVSRASRAWGLSGCTPAAVLQRLRFSGCDLATVPQRLLSSCCAPRLQFIPSSAASISVRTSLKGIGHTLAAPPLPGVPELVGPACAETRW
jgi:hypothetical protein